MKDLALSGWGEVYPELDEGKPLYLKILRNISTSVKNSNNTNVIIQNPVENNMIVFRETI